MSWNLNAVVTVKANIQYNLVFNSLHTNQYNSNGKFIVILWELHNSSDDTKAKSNNC